MTQEIPNLALNSALKRHSELQSQMLNSMDEARAIWEKMKKQREQELQRILKEQGLSVCAHHTHHGVGETEKEKLGLFRSSEMRLLYRETYQGHEGHEYEQTEHKVRFVALCPYHFPKNPNRPWQSGVFDDQLSMTSEVVKHDDGRLFTVIDSKEVKVPTKEPHCNEEVYRHFELPLLPEFPSDPIWLIKIPDKVH